jgi:hypothetical protein
MNNNKTNIRLLINTWSKLKYSQINFNDKNINQNNIKKIKDCFNSLKLNDLLMDGLSTEKLEKTSESSGGLNYSEIFHRLIKQNKINPGLFLAAYASDYIDSNKDYNKLAGFLARGLRTFASMIREQDFANIIQRNLIEDDKQLSINMNPEQDTKTHVDIRIKFKNKEFNIWTYQASKNAIYPHTIERVTSQRGELENGYHLLCPINTEEGKKLLQKRKSFINSNDKIKKWKNDIETINKQTKKYGSIINKIQRRKELLNKIKKEIDQIEKGCVEEIEIMNGWFLYSESYIKKVSKIIKAEKIKIEFNYNELVNKLLTPERILKRITLFKK